MPSVRHNVIARSEYRGWPPRDPRRGAVQWVRASPVIGERYAVSLTAAILKWLTITDQRAMLVVGKEGFIDWVWSSDPLLKSNIYYAARQRVTELPGRSLAAQNVDREIARNGVQHPAGVWKGQEPVQEMTVYGRQNEMTISLLLYPRHARSGWAGAEIEEEPVSDTYDRFVSKG